MRLYEGEAAKAIPQLEEREGYSAYWRGVYGGVYLDDVLFEAGATLTYEQLMESLGSKATSLPVPEGSSTRLAVCAYYAPDGSAETDEKYLQLLPTHGGQTIRSVPLAPADANLPHSYTPPAGVPCPGRAGGAAPGRGRAVASRDGPLYGSTGRRGGRGAGRRGGGAATGGGGTGAAAARTAGAPTATRRPGSTTATACSWACGPARPCRRAKPPR